MHKLSANKIKEIKSIITYLSNLTMDSELGYEMKRNAMMALNDLLNIDAGVKGQYPVHKYDYKTNVVTTELKEN